VSRALEHAVLDADSSRCGSYFYLTVDTLDEEWADEHGAVPVDLPGPKVWWRRRPQPSSLSLSHVVAK